MRVPDRVARAIAAPGRDAIDPDRSEQLLVREGLEVRAGREFFRAETADEFADEITSAITEPALRDDVARAGRRLVEHRYSVQALTRQLMSILPGSPS